MRHCNESPGSRFGLIRSFFEATFWVAGRIFATAGIEGPGDKLRAVNASRTARVRRRARSRLRPLAFVELIAARPRHSSPAVKYQTSGLDKTVRNKDRVNWSGPFGGGKLKADGSLVLSQARPCSVAPGPVAKSVMTPGLGGVPRLRRSRLGEYSFCTARAVALAYFAKEDGVSWRGSERVFRIFL